MVEEQQWYYLTHIWEDKWVRTFPNGINPKINAIARLDFELMYFDVATQHFNHYATDTRY